MTLTEIEIIERDNHIPPEKSILVKQTSNELYDKEKEKNIKTYIIVDSYNGYRYSLIGTEEQYESYKKTYMQSEKIIFPMHLTFSEKIMIALYSGLTVKKQG